MFSASGWVVLIKGIPQAGVGRGAEGQEGRGLFFHWESEGPIQCSSSSDVPSDEDDTALSA